MATPPGLRAIPRLTCHGCGQTVQAIGDSGVAWRCPHAGEGDVDHVLRPALTEPPAEPESWADTSSEHPFVRYRALLGSHAAAGALGIGDAEFVAEVERLDERVASVEGRGFHVTPFGEEAALANAAGLDGARLLVKAEPGNVSGSHKARHLMGVALWLRVEALARARGALSPPAGDAPRLAIASCGNAALAAAVVAAAAHHALDVFVPTWASPAIVDRLRALGASISACARTPGAAGDPCYHGFRAAIARGATPFCCQGPDNGLTIEGGETIAWEVVDALGGDVPDAAFVQVGGGALATAVARGFLEARHRGRASRVPRLHAVQTYGCAPLVRAYDLVAQRVLEAAGDTRPPLDTLSPASARARAERAGVIEALRSAAHIDEALRFAATDRSGVMWPWETEPHSLATGILDDETYDWFAIVEAMLRTGGYPVLASEETLARANALARDVAGLDACFTGTAGLAGVMDAVALDERLRGERVLVICSGRRR